MYLIWQDKEQIMRKLVDYEPIYSSQCSIYKIPDTIRKLNEVAYTPQVVSIGPIHHNNPAFQAMEMHKAGYLQAFLQRTKKSLDDFIAYIIECEDRVRSCYSQTFQFADFRSMLLLDGIFIIEYFMVMCLPDDCREMHGKMLYLPLNIETDLILLENQLPFFLLEGLYNLAFLSVDTDDDPPPFHQIVYDFFSQFNLIDSNSTLQFKHFTDLLIKCQIPRTWTRRKDHCHDMVQLSKQQAQWTKSATVLQEAGVKFRVGKGESFCDIKFTDGVLEIPSFTFRSSTESFVRNLMAMEQCHYPHQTYICNYFFFLDNLINTARDVDLLVENGIIINWLGDSEAVANLVNTLLRNVIVSSFGFYAELCQNLNAHCDVGWHRWRVSFKRDYLGTPWKIASTSAAVILLLLTLVQTICSIISLAKGKC